MRLGKQARLTEFITASAITSGADTYVSINVNGCSIDLGDEDDRATVMLTVLPEGKGSLDVAYNVKGGSIRLSHPRWVKILEKSTTATYTEGAEGYTKLYLPKAYSPDLRIASITESGYASYAEAATVANVTEYNIVRSAGSTLYGVIPDEYLDTQKYPFALFREGEFIGAYSKWSEATSAAQDAVNSAEFINTRAELVLRRNYQNTYQTGDAGAVINSATNILIDLCENTFISDDVGIDLTGSYNSAPYKTAVTVKNGNVQVYRGIA